jgi:hypothetical protein
MKAPLLQLFSINDAADPSIRTNLIEIVPVSNGATANPESRMRQWLQHVYLMGSQLKPFAFDLMFIDIRFERDPHAPRYGGLNPGQKPVSKSEHRNVNPLGLMHALTFASRQDPFGRPFVWGYHSGDPKSVKDDPVAIIAFSLLAALEQRGAAGDINVFGSPWKWDDFGLHRAPEYAVQHFSKAIACLPRGGPEVILSDMIRRYHLKLLHRVGEDRIGIEHDGLETALRLASSATAADRRALAACSIKMFGKVGQRWTRELLLQSLFADKLIDRTDIWPEGKILDALKEFLVVLKELSLSETKEQLVAQVDEIMALIEIQQPKVLKSIRPAKRKRIGALAIVCWWLEQKAAAQVAIANGWELKPPSTNQLLFDFGYGDRGAHRGPMENCLEPLGYFKLAKFFDDLETIKLRPPFHEVGRYWWKNRCGAAESAMPACLR